MKTFLLISTIIGLSLAYPSDNDDVKVVGGANAARNQFPYQVSMQWGLLGIWQHICGGSVIAARTVLTAAHCITEVPNIGSFRIRAGILLLNDPIGTFPVTSVSTAIIHPDYHGGVNPHDIALLRLSTALAFGASISPIPLPQPGSMPTGNGVLSGWGSTSNTETPSMPNHMQFVSTPIIGLNVCRSRLIELFGNADPVHDTSTLCTMAAGQSGCSGDSGGPLTNNGTVVGVASWAVIPCGAITAPTGFARVSSYIDFINDNIL